MAARGPEWLTWVDGLATGTRVRLEEWDLRPDGDALPGAGALVVPVRTSDGTHAVLKISFPDPESEHEHLVLRRWAGNGAARLLRADPRGRAVLLERLRTQNLRTLPDADACKVVARLYRRLHVPALPQLPTLTSYVERWTRDFEALPRNAPIPRRLVQQAITLSNDLSADSTDGATVLHGDLHHGKVLAGNREPWLAIAPRPCNGDPHYELAPMLWHHWDELTGHIREGVRTRFHTIVDIAGLDEERARAWVIVRVVREAARELSGTARADDAKLTRYVALAKAVQD